MPNENPKQPKKNQKQPKPDQTQPNPNESSTDQNQPNTVQKPPEVVSLQPTRSAKYSFDHDKITMIERIPYTNYFCLIFGLRCGSMWIGITGIILGCVTFLAYLILIGRSELDLKTVLLLLLLALQALVTILFIVGSVLLIVAACCDSPVFIPAYIWISIIYWSIEMLLGIFIPIVLFLEGGRSLFIGLIWSCLVMILSLLWTHYLAVVKSYMWDLYEEGAAA